ncbi:MAG: GtrA family protein [Bacilli bacterium]|nr:GtrA family protein [Bacilli bacterium]
MKLYLYDWDGTIYDGDSSADFFKYCLKKDKKLFFHLFKCIIPFIKYKTKYINITEFKEIVFSFLKTINNVDEYVKDFWKLNKNKIKSFYLENDHSKDIIISASPEFLLKPICKELKVKDLIASEVNKKTGKFNKPNCRGEEKVIVFRKKYPKAEIMEMYSDSMHDKPLLDLAKKSYMIIGNKIYDYETYRPNILKRFWLWGWSIYHKNEELWNYLIVGGLTTIVAVGSYAFFAKSLELHYITSNILSWIIAVVFAYFTNRLFVFKSTNKEKFKEFIKFSGSRITTLVIETGLLILLIDIVLFDEVWSKVIGQIVVLVLNYIISKLIVFKEKKKI